MTVYVAGDYEYELKPEFQCDSCGRVTLSMLCGCENAKPRECGRIWFARSVRPVRALPVHQLSGEGSMGVRG